MSTFNGRLHNPMLNFIAIDEFSDRNHDASVFFLSHAHLDHLQGFYFFSKILLNSSSNKTLYCTRITKRLLQIKYPNISDNNVVSLDVGESCLLRAPQKSEDEDALETSTLITVTLLPTLHVLGSVMFLFECRDICALYTGDFRIHTGDVSEMKGLHKDGKPLKITELYLDTTFADETHIWFPKRESAIAKIIELSEEWLDESDKNHVALTIVSYYGYESLIIDLSEALKTKILVDDKVFSHFKYIPEMDKAITFSYSTETSIKRPRIDCNRLGRIHVCLFNSFGNSYCKPCKESDKLREIKPCAYSFHLKPDDYTNICEKSGSNFKVAYSTHCSLTELKFFTDYLKPTNIYPSVLNRKDPNSYERILALLLKTPSESTLDDENLAELSHTDNDTDYESDESDESEALSLDSPPF